MSGYIHRIFRRFKPGDPVAAVANVHDDDLIKNFIEGLHGVGCRVVKNPAGGLRDTRIIVDGTSDDGSDITADMEAARLDSLAQSQSQYPYGSTRWLWGVDVLTSRTTVDGVSCPQILIGTGAALYRQFSGLFAVNGATVTIDADNGSVYWTSDATAGYTDYNTITVATTLGSTTEREHYEGVGSPATGVLYYVTSTTADNVRTIQSIVPYQFGPIRRPILPAGDATYTHIHWDDTMKQWRLES